MIKMTVYLKSDQLSVEISELGAELTSIIQNDTGIEYLWQGDPEYWGRQSPILFPIVGRLKEDQYTYQNNTYSLNQHGFARDKVFQIVSQTDSEAVFELSSSKETEIVFPFSFSLFIRYVLYENSIHIMYAVENKETERMMYFSIGGHPGFNVPLTEDTVFEDYYISFLPRKTRTVIPLDGPWIDLKNKTLGQTDTSLALSRKLFEKDALIYETEGTNSFTIESDKHSHRVEVETEDFPYVGIWTAAKQGSPFICIEPWYGIADTIESSGELKEKIGIQSLEPQQTFQANYSITID